MEVQTTGNDAGDYSKISQISDDIALTRDSIDNPTHDSLPGTFARLREWETKNWEIEPLPPRPFEDRQQLDPNYTNILVCSPLKDKLDGLDTRDYRQVRKKTGLGLKFSEYVADNR